MIGKLRTASLSEATIASAEQTVEMFEVITANQPQDYMSLEILRKAYHALGNEEKFIEVSKRMIQAHLGLSRLSDALLECEFVLQRRPDDKDILEIVKEIKAKSVASHP